MARMRHGLSKHDAGKLYTFIWKQKPVVVQRVNRLRNTDGLSWEQILAKIQ